MPFYISDFQLRGRVTILIHAQFISHYINRQKCKISAKQVVWASQASAHLWHGTRPEFSRVAFSLKQERRSPNFSTYRKLVRAPMRGPTTWLGPFWGSGWKSKLKHGRTAFQNWPQQSTTPPWCKGTPIGYNLFGAGNINKNSTRSSICCCCCQFVVMRSGGRCHI